MDRSHPPLSPSEHTAPDHLEQAADAEATLAHERAVAHLIDAGFVTPAAHDLITALCRKGYLADSETGLRVTARE